MNITKQMGTIIQATSLTKTAKEVTIELGIAIECTPGSFMNIFMDINGTRVRRAFSVVATNQEEKTVSFAIRHTPDGLMTPEFWKQDIIGRNVEVMGPLGINTSDKLIHENVFLFGYGIGAGVVKAITQSSLNKPGMKNITIVTGSRSEDAIIYKEYFDSIIHEHPHVSVRYVLSAPAAEKYLHKGYIQDNIDDLVFNDADIYLCGQEAACEALTQKIKSKHPENVSFFVEAFH